MFEETILEQTEIVLLAEMRKAAADAVTQSLAKVSTTESTDNKKTEEKDNMLLSMNVNWDQIACLTDALIESIPNSLAENTAWIHVTALHETWQIAGKYQETYLKFLWNDFYINL